MAKSDNYEKNKHLIGTQINKWTILDIVIYEDRHHTYATAQCVCGTIKEVRLSYITNNKTKDCGCGHKDRLNEATIKRYEHLINTQVNGWTILKIIPANDKYNYTRALCKCKCGTIKEVKLSYIIHGKSKDCGCGRKEIVGKINEKDLVGQRFGKLLVVENIYGRSKSGRKLYRCLCDCGNEIILHTNQLTTHHTSSCGCLLSYYNMYIAKLLNEYQINYKSEFTIWVDDEYFRFDFYLPKYNLFIEYDGQQHYEPVRFGNQTDEEIESSFKETQRRDKIKNKYCEDNNINLLRIPYWESKNIETIIINHLQRLSEKGFTNVA